MGRNVHDFRTLLFWFPLPLMHISRIVDIIATNKRKALPALTQPAGLFSPVNMEQISMLPSLRIPILHFLRLGMGAGFPSDGSDK